MIAHKETQDEQNWYWFIKFLKELQPYQIKFIENILAEVENYQKHNDIYKIPHENFQLIYWISRNYIGVISTYNGLLIVMESCDKPYGNQTIFDNDKS